MMIRALVLISLLALGSYELCQNYAGTSRRKDLDRNASCEKYIKLTLPRIIEDWKFAEWERRATSELRLGSDLPAVKQRFKVYKKYLGRFRTLTDPVGTVKVEDIRGTLLPVGYYVSRADFRFASASITMKLVYRGGGWKYSLFSIRSNLSLPVDED